MRILQDHPYQQGGDYISQEALELIFSFIDNPTDRSSISLVCRKWHAVDKLTRKHVTIAFAYSVSPVTLSRRFRGLQSLKLKGKPRAAMFDLIPDNWGGYAGPWVKEISVNCPCLRSVHFRRMVITDEDLIMLARLRGNMLHDLRLDRCCGFSTIGLEAIVQCCRVLRVLLIDDSLVQQQSGRWLHELALHNSSLETLSFCASSISEFDVADLETLVANCRSLRTLRVNDVDLNKLSIVLRVAAHLKEFGGVSLCERDDGTCTPSNELLSLPGGLTSLVGLMYLGDDDNEVKLLIQPVASTLKKLDLQLTALTVDGHSRLLCHCTNLEVLEVLNDIGDEGLDVVSKTCKKLRRLRVESGDRDFQQGYVTHQGLISITKGCADIEYIAMYISSIDNAALTAVGNHCSKLKDFRLVLLADDSCVSEFPLDAGVHALMQGCTELRRLALYLQRGSLTDMGMRYIGKFGSNLRWMLLGLVGETNAGLSLLADGCPKLEKLEMRDCVFTEAGISSSMLKLKALKYLWVQGYNATDDGHDLFGMSSIPFWNIEFVPEQDIVLNSIDDLEVKADGMAMCKKPAQFLAYHSLAGPRTDRPETVVHVWPKCKNSVTMT